MINIPYDPILHDLSLTPREMSAAEIVEFWLGKRHSRKMNIRLFNLDMFDTKDVTEWMEHFHIVDIPDLKFVFSGIFGHILMLQFDLNTTIAIAEPFMGRYRKHKTIIKRSQVNFLKRITPSG